MAGITQGVASAQLGNQAMEQLVLQFLQTRGYSRAEELLRKDLEAAGAGNNKNNNNDNNNGGGGMAGNALSVEELAAKTGLHMSRLERDGTTVNGSTTGHLQEEVSRVLMADPTIYHSEYANLRAWIMASLDLYKPELELVLWPIFVHSYLDLVDKLHLDAARDFLEKNKSDHPLHDSMMASLSHITLPHHVETSQLAIAFRTMRYRVKLTKVSFDLLIHYLSERSSSVIADKPLGNVMMTLFNDHLEIHVLDSAPSKIKTRDFAQGVGLVGLDQDSAAPSVVKVAGQGDLQSIKLGPQAQDLIVRDEINRALAAEDQAEEERSKRAGIQTSEDGLRPRDEVNQRPPKENTLVNLYSQMKPDPKLSPSVYAASPAPGEPPMPSARLVDIQREVEIVKEYRSRMRLGPHSDTTLPSVCAYTFHNTVDGLNCTTFSDDSTILAAGFGESYIRLLSLAGKTFKGMRSDFIPGHISDQAQLQKLREKSGQETRTLIGHSGPVYGLSFSPDQQFLLSCSEDSTARLWSMDTLTNVAVYRGHTFPIWDISFSPQGHYFATASFDRTARLWTTDRISPLRLFAGHISDVECVKFHPNCLYLATGSADRTSRLWDVQRGACVRVMTGHTGAVTTLSVSPDGKSMATADESNTIRLWDLGMGTCVRKLVGHTAPVHSISFNQESNLIVSGSSDSTVRTWNAQSGQDDKSLLATFYTKNTPIYSTHCTRRNLFLVAGPYQGPVK